MNLKHEQKLKVSYGAFPDMLKDCFVDCSREGQSEDKYNHLLLGTFAPIQRPAREARARCSCWSPTATRSPYTSTCTSSWPATSSSRTTWLPSSSRPQKSWPRPNLSSPTWRTRCRSATTSSSARAPSSASCGGRATSGWSS